MTARPAPTACATGAELDRWYWTKDELVTLARARGVPTAGSKVQLAAALRDHLDGLPARPSSPSRRRAAPALPEPLSRATVLPPGQRCTQQLRRFCIEQAGRQFRFDATVRAFVAASDGTGTVNDLLDRWARPRSTAPSVIEPQFELNRFLRRWHDEHPEGGRPAALEAWRRHRALPVEQRG